MPLRPNLAVALYFIINYLHTVSHKRLHPSSCPVTLFLLKDVPQLLKIDRREERNTWLDWSSVKPRQISLKYNLSSPGCVHISHISHKNPPLCIANLKKKPKTPSFWEVGPPHPRSSALALPVLPLSRSPICQTAMFDYSTNGCLRASLQSAVSVFPAARRQI